MTGPKLTLIKGLRDEHLADIYKIADAEVTDTRLMGVLGLHIHWLVSEGSAVRHMHQFYYYDVVEIGLDFVASVNGNDGAEIAKELKGDFGGLGARMVPVSDAEARYLARFFIEDTKKRFGTLPPEAHDLDYVTNVPHGLDGEGVKALWDKICTPVETAFGAINYFLMRCFAMDFEGAAWLASPQADEDMLKAVKADGIGELLRNSISVSDDGEQPLYLCESLVETDRGHSLIFSELKLEGLKVSSAKLNSVMRISEDEAAMKLMREEYLDVYDFESPGPAFDSELDELTLGATENPYPDGLLYMQFKADNRHVEKPLYRLNDDVEAIYYIGRLGEDDPQLVVSGFSYESIKRAEARVAKVFGFADEPVLIGKFHFDESLIFEFANSGFDDFIDYIDSLGLQGE